MFSSWNSKCKDDIWPPHWAVTDLCKHHWTQSCIISISFFRVFSLYKKNTPKIRLSACCCWNLLIFKIIFLMNANSTRPWWILLVVLVVCLQPEAENFKKLNVISQDEFDTLSPKVPIDPNQEVPTPPMQGESSSDAVCVEWHAQWKKKHSQLFFL